MNNSNLKAPQSTEEAREKGRLGGIASGKARRAKKSAKEFALAALYAKTKDKNGKEVVAIDDAIQKQITKAVNNGDLKALTFLLELIGEAPTSRVDVTTNGKDIAIPQLIFSPTPLTDKDLEEIKNIQNGTTESSTDTSISEVESSL